ncbi:MAG: phosphopentomutase, partial [Buchnera aphidicola]|nr:phosphopentomutase [Buchnera aphidicola]
MMLDSFGIGSSLDAHKFNDIGADTFGHIAEHCFLGLANSSKRIGKLNIPNLTRLGIVQASKKSRGSFPLGTNCTQNVIASYGFASEISSGKDTSSGHWELAGVPVLSEWYYFKEKENSFPVFLIE